jgi:hypothetical protein
MIIIAVFRNKEKNKYFITSKENSGRVFYNIKTEY